MKRVDVDAAAVRWRRDDSDLPSDHRTGQSHAFNLKAQIKMSLIVTIQCSLFVLEPLNIMKHVTEEEVPCVTTRKTHHTGAQ